MGSGRVAHWLGRQVAIEIASPVTNRVADYADAALHVHDVASSTRRGGRGLHAASIRRDQFGREIVGGQFWHSGSDRSGALAQLGLDFEAFQADVVAGAHVEADKTWIAADVAPALAAWRQFVSRIAASKLAAYVTEWSVFVAWQDRLIRLRGATRARGIHLESPEPVQLPQTVWERAASGNGTGLDTWLTLGKTVVFGAIAVTGVAGLYGILRNARGRMTS